MRYWAECGDFFRECRRHFRTTGSILPSSRFLARALVTPLKAPRDSGRILEVGPGTGSVTRAILRYLRPGDHLDAVEINYQFVRHLRARLEKDWSNRTACRQVRIIHSAVEHLPGEGVYDFIISGLPLNNFPVSTVRDIFRAYSRLLKPGGLGISSTSPDLPGKYDWAAIETMGSEDPDSKFSIVSARATPGCFSSQPDNAAAASF